MHRLYSSYSRPYLSGSPGKSLLLLLSVTPISRGLLRLLVQEVLGLDERVHDELSRVSTPGTLPLAQRLISHLVVVELGQARHDNDADGRHGVVVEPDGEA